MDQVRLPAYLVEGNATLLYSNNAGADALKAGDFFKSASDILCAVHPADNARLRAAIAGTYANGERQTIMINDVRSARPTLITAIAYHDDEPDVQKGVIVFVQRCEPADDVFTNALRQLFRLSGAETAIAAALVAGADIEQIAEMRHAKITTVRTQIAAMLLKTRTRRQGELIALFSRICSLP
jgi:DNA-binding CsgD family transcriptional regulator